MIEDELLAEHLVKRSDDKQRVGRIVRVDDVESFAHRDVDTQHETADREVQVFGQIAHDDPRLVQERVQPRPLPIRKLLEEGQATKPVDRHAVDDFMEALTAVTERNDGHFETIVGQRERFVPNARVVRKRVLDQHQDSTSRFLHSCPSARHIRDRHRPSPGACR